jgi:hypothetical protein
MKKDKSTEKQFLEYLDRLLAGEPITVGDELSDEARSALELARKMLAFREEPSEEFRADLRDRLLRQIAEKQAAAYPSPEREGFWERVANLLPPRPVLVAVASTAAVVLLLFIGVVWFTGRNVGSPLATVPPPPAVELFPRGYSLKLPANIVPEGAYFTANTSLSDSPGKAMVYIVSNDYVTAATATVEGRRLGFFRGKASLSDDGTKYVMTQGSGEDEKQMTIWTASGAVEYGYVSPDKLYPSTPPSLPSQSDAKTIALNFLDQADLVPPAFTRDILKDEATVVAGSGYSVGKIYTEAAPPATSAAPSAPSAPSAEAPPSEPSEKPAPTAAPPAPTGAPAPTYWLVEFPYFVDGAEATGPGSKIEVRIGDKGEVVAMIQWSRRLEGYVGERAVISPHQAFQDLTQGKGSLDIPVDCRQVVVEQVQLKYWLDPPSEKQDFIVPVYEFTGQCLDKNGNHLENFTGWTPALSGTN